MDIKESLIGCLLHGPQPRNKLITQACVLIENQTYNTLMYRTTDHPAMADLMSWKSHPHLSSHFLTSHFMHISYLSPNLCHFLIKSSMSPLTISSKSSFVLILLDVPTAFVPPGHFFFLKIVSLSQACHSLLVFLFTAQNSLTRSFVSVSCSDLWIPVFSRVRFWALFSSHPRFFSLVIFSIPLTSLTISIAMISIYPEYISISSWLLCI